MSQKALKVNELLKREIAAILNQEINPDGYLITVSKVSCSPDLKNAKVFVLVLPERRLGSALARIRKKAGVISNQLSKKTRLREIPKLKFLPDLAEIEAAKIRDAIAKLPKQ